MLAKFRHNLKQHLTDPITPIFIKMGMTPNVLTILGFVLSLGAACLLASGRFFAGGILVLFSGVFDLLDGAVAQATGQSTRFGALLDSTLDRCSEALLLGGLLVFYMGRQPGQEVFLIYIAFACSVLVSYVKARAEGLGLKCEVGILTRGERIVLLALGLLLNQVIIVLWILAILTPLTAAHRFIYIWQQIRKQPQEPASNPQQNHDNETSPEADKKSTPNTS